MFVDSFKKQYLELSFKVKLFESIYNGIFNVYYVIIQNFKVDFCEEFFFFIIIYVDIYIYIFIYIYVIENLMFIIINFFVCVIYMYMGKVNYFRCVFFKLWRFMFCFNDMFEC